MGIKIITPENRAEWLKLRRNYITATNIRDILGLGYNTPLEVLQEKRGFAPEVEPNDSMMVGTIMEPWIRRWYLTKHGVTSILSTGEKIWVDDDRHLAATPDLLCAPYEDKDKLHLVEIKTSTRGWHEDVPMKHRIQIRMQAGLTGAWSAAAILLQIPEHMHKGIISRFVNGEDQDMSLFNEPELYPVPLVEDEIRVVTERATDWYEDHVVLGLPLLEQIAPTKKPAPAGVVEAPDLLKEWKTAKDLEKANEEVAEKYKEIRKEVEGRITALLGDKASKVLDPTSEEKLSRAWSAIARRRAAVKASPRSAA